MMERFVSAVTSKDIHIRPIENKDPKKIAILGSGPAGLSCAYFLALLGHRPTVFEAKKEPGGVMRWGIPQFRLPKAALKKDIRRILALPVKLRTNCRVGKDLSFRELEKFDAVFLSPGAGLNALLSIEGEDLEGVWNGGEFLERIKAEEKISLGQKTVVIGGGNTAMDVARSASRLGSSVTIAYRRTRDEMPAIRDEIDEAEEEGIEFKFLIQPLRIRQASAGKLEVTFQRMQLGARDESNRRRVIPIEGESLMLEADSVISAVGELVDLSSVPEDLVKDGYITSGVSPRIFAGGDAVLQPRTIANAIASAKAAAISMDLFFRGIGDDQIVSKIKTGRKGSLSMEAYLQARENGEWPDAKEVISHQQINTLYFEKSGRAKVRKLSRARRPRIEKASALSRGRPTCAK